MKRPPGKPSRLLLAMHSFGQSYMHVPELLGRTGIPVDAVFTPKHPLRRVRGLSKTFVADAPDWAATVEERLLTGDYELLLNVDEPGLHSLYRHSWHPEAAKFLPLTEGSEVAATVGSKKLFHEWCLKSGLPVPETHICTGLDEAVATQRQLTGKWLLKGDTGSGGQCVIRGPRDWNSKMAPCLQTESWLVQRDEGRAVGSGIFLADHGRLLAWMGIKKIVCLNKGFGPTVFGRGDASPDLGELCRRVAAASGVTGMTGFDFVRNAERGPLLIDSHLGRMSPMQHFDRLYDVDFASALRAWLLEGNSCETASPQEGQSFIKFPELLQLIVQGGLVRLLKDVDFRASMPMSPAGDPFTGCRSACSTVFSQARVNIGRWRRMIFPAL
ncbi:MAG: hypothetical protein WCH98_03490 [Verrucomicrobiota bacterium]